MFWSGYAVHPCFGKSSDTFTDSAELPVPKLPGIPAWLHNCHADTVHLLVLALLPVQAVLLIQENA
jgi:Ni,Fe-hydrogenase I small subunit